jgi:glucose dehydrogenase
MAGLDALIPPGSASVGAVASSGHPLTLPAGPSEVGKASGTTPTDADLLHVAAANWLTYNRDYAGDRYSPLSQIDTGNVASLKRA